MVSWWISLRAVEAFAKGTLYPLFLFTIVTEVISRRLNRLAGNQSFYFHLKCKRVGLTHLMLADDLLIFAKAKESAIQCINAVSRRFRLVWIEYKFQKI